MKYFLLLSAFFSASVLIADSTTVDNPKAVPETKNITVVCPQNECPSVECPSVKAPEKEKPQQEQVLTEDSNIRISVVGQGVAPMNTSSPAQAYALAKRAATADAYRLIAEKVKGVRIDGQDLIKNMMVKRSTIRTTVTAMVRNATVVETTFKEGLCEVEMEIVLSRSDFAQ